VRATVNHFVRPQVATEILLVSLDCDCSGRSPNVKFSCQIKGLGRTSEEVSA
jgi:hypothetical protein